MTVARRAQARMKGVPRNVRDKALWDGVGAVVVEHGWVNVVGPDAGTFLQGQVTQDVLALGVGEAAWAFVLEPDGKVLALIRVAHLFDEVYGLDMEVGETEVVLERLKRFLLRVDCELSMLPPRTMIAIRGPDVPHVKFPESALVSRLPVGWPGVLGIDLVGGTTDPPPNLPVCRPEALEALRIESGWPMSGVDIAPGAVVADAPSFVIDQAVSFTKGCYTGQELVERMHSRNAPAPHPLRGLHLGDGAPVPPNGAEITVDGEVVGPVTSAAWSAWREGPVAMARIARKVTRPVAGVVRWKDDEAAVRIVDLP
jgi:folate-binding protein YgfZ